MSVVTAGVVMDSALLDHDASGLLAVASQAERAARLAEVARLEVLSAWATIHSSDPTEGPDGHIVRRVGNVLRHLGGEGTPGVQDFCRRDRPRAEPGSPLPLMPWPTCSTSSTDCR